MVIVNALRKAPTPDDAEAEPATLSAAGAR